MNAIGKTGTESMSGTDLVGLMPALAIPGLPLDEAALRQQRALDAVFHVASR